MAREWIRSMTGWMSSSDALRFSSCASSRPSCAKGVSEDWCQYLFVSYNAIHILCNYSPSFSNLKGGSSTSFSGGTNSW